MIKIGNAPVSYGAFEVTVGIDENVPTAPEVLDAVEAAGYEGIDLGPLGYLGIGEDLKKALVSRNLLLTGGYVEIDVSNEEAGARGFAELEQACDQFQEVSGGVETVLLPRPTVALIAREERARAETPAESWARIEKTLGTLVERCHRRGFEACLHNEVGTEIATQEDIERALTSSPVSLCLDTGHLVAAGGDPVTVLEAWSARISHVHLKDANVPNGASYQDAMKLWDENVFCRLGAGNGRIEETLAFLRDGNYSGWVVVEQDVLPRGKAAYDRARTDQIENRQYLRDRGW
jgi:inosose dehydratase